MPKKKTREQPSVDVKLMRPLLALARMVIDLMEQEEVRDVVVRSCQQHLMEGFWRGNQAISEYMRLDALTSDIEDILRTTATQAERWDPQVLAAAHDLAKRLTDGCFNIGSMRLVELAPEAVKLANAALQEAAKPETTKAVVTKTPAKKKKPSKAGTKATKAKAKAKARSKPKAPAKPKTPPKAKLNGSAKRQLPLAGTADAAPVQA